MPALCRDCGAVFDAPSSQCPTCGGDRLLVHEELLELSIAHIDCDAFFAAIEKRDNPEIANQPVIVGGGRRGVVATCCYIARLYGVRSAMPMFKALKACPDAVVIRPDHAKYSAESQRVREKLNALTPQVQPVSIDEAYLDLSGTERINRGAPAQTLVRVAQEIEQEIGITVSMGLAPNKFLAKLASEMDKPKGFAIIGKAEARTRLALMSLRSVHGIGPKFAAKLSRDGYDTIGDIQDLDPKALISAYGETGLWLHNRANGIDNRPVSTGSERKSVSSETTFFEDISDPQTLTDHLWKICERTAERAKKVGVEGSTLTLKLKTKSFRTLTRSRSLPHGTQLAQTLFRTLRPALDEVIQSGDAYRLIGVGLTNLQPAGEDVVDLIDPSIAKRAAAERAADLAREKFGSGAVITGRAARLDARRRKP